MAAFRYLARHPLFLPLVGIFAVLVTAVVMQATGAVGQQAHPTVAARASADAALSGLAGSIAAVELARDGALADRIRVRMAGERSVWLVLDEHSRITVPTDGRNILGGPLDLATGQAVSIELIEGAGVRNGSIVARLRVAEPDAAPAFD